MAGIRISQSEFIYEFYEDLDIVFDGTVEVEEYNPGKPVPKCSNPSSPAYSDPGEAEEIGAVKMILTVNGTPVVVDPVTAERIFKIIESKVQSRIDRDIMRMNQDAMIDRYEDRMMERRGA